jgi:hypothetical protein
MRTILKRAILRTLEQRGYVLLLKKAAYDHMLAASAPVAPRAGRGLTTIATMRRLNMHSPIPEGEARIPTRRDGALTRMGHCSCNPRS